MNSHNTTEKARPAAESGLTTPALWSRRRASREAGKVRPMILLWALGVPLPIIAIIFLVRGCS